MSNKTIFIQIASYRDPELIPTLKDITEKAKNPQNLNICICWQHAEDETYEIFNGLGKFKTINENPTVLSLENGSTIKILDVPYNKTKGACWARNMIQKHYNGEDYTLQLDSHHRFVEGWDEICIDMLEGLRSKEVPKPLLTAYIPSYNPANDPEERVQVPWKMDFDRFIPEGAVFFRPSTIEGHENMDKPVPSRFFSAHFAFADGVFAEEVQHDPEYFFHGEEISIAVRAFTHGYDLFHPHKVIAWHEYTRNGRTKVWDDHTTTQKNKGKVEKDWVERNNICHKRNRILFGMDGEYPNQIDFGKYGFGDKRTVREYEEYAGISFDYRGVQKKTVDKEYPPNNYKYETENEWRDSFLSSNDFRVCVHKGEFGDLPEDIDFCFVGCHDKDGNEIYRKDLQGHAFKAFINKGDWVDYQFIFLCEKHNRPVTYTLWPHSKSQGWLKKVDKYVG